MILDFIVPDFGISRSISSAFLIGILIGSMISSFLLIRRYLVSFSVNDGKFILTYLTNLARQRQIIIQADTLSGAKVKRKAFLMIDFPVLKLISKDREIEFYLLNTELNKTALAFVQAFNDKQLPPNT